MQMDVNELQHLCFWNSLLGIMPCIEMIVR